MRKLKLTLHCLDERSEEPQGKGQFQLKAFWVNNFFSEYIKEIFFLY